jgi:hypothetical protein
MWVTNNPVTNIVRSGNTIYIAGVFSQVGPYTGSGVILNQSDGKLASTPLLKINGTVYASVSDRRGGWFIGGDFTQVQGVVRNRLAHILANGNLDQTWNPDANTTVYTLAVLGNIVYIGGDFTNVGGQARNYVAALDASTGQATDWNPDANTTVYTLAVSGNVVYVGGNFTGIGGQSRNHLAAIDAITGEVTAWNPNPNSGVDALAVFGNVVYAGGYFTSMGSQPRNNFVAFGKPVVQPNFIKGNIFEDTNGDCVRNINEKGMTNIIIVAQPGNYFTSSDLAGNYILRVDTGSYRVEQVIPADKANFIKQVCPINPTTHSVRFTSSADTIIGKDFANQATLPSYLTVSVSSNRRRRCMTNTTTVSYCNSGTGEQKMPKYIPSMSS